MKPTSLKGHLESELGKEIASKVNRSFEVVGTIAIIEVPEEIKKYTKQIGEALMKTNKSVKTVLKKAGIHEGELRTQKMDYVCGENTKETTYLENGIRLKLNVEKVYFSSKLGTERMLLAKNVKPNSKVLVMFSGCGPYTFNILKRQPNVELIDSIELNQLADKYAVMNVELNKNLVKKSNYFKELIEQKKKDKEKIVEEELMWLTWKKKVCFYCGDVRKVIDDELKDRTYDEIFMPLPKDAQLFLDSAFKVCTKNTLIHMYDFQHENDFPKLTEEAVKKAAKAANKKVKIISTRKVGQYSPRKYRVCCDFKIL